MFIGPSI